MAREESANYVLLTRLADEFAARYRSGERPPLQEYIDRYPELAGDIRELFPAMVEIEQVKEDHQEAAEQAAAPASPALQQLGDFRIIREVGKGGMGIVYEAEQVSLGRHVALKVLPKNLLLDARAKRRFEREAKSAAKLHHTNIVPVFGVGEQDGLPYYVMQFIQGLGLDEVLEELKKLQVGNAKTGTFTGGELRVSRKALSAVHVARSLLTGEFQQPNDQDAEEAAAAPEVAARKEDQAADTPGSPALSDSFTLSSSSVVLPGRSRDGSKSKHRKQTYWQSVASIGVQVAEALEYAHKQGIHHRDIKPSNLLLDTQGTVWVTDFGLAKADDQQNLTHTGDILGTLRYMPPEAFEGKSDARGDLYSLGLTLYEMLGFRPAFDEKERNRLVKQVTSVPPTRLGKLNRSVPRDLETIVHKAIDREPGQRYQTAADLAADLQRFIDDEPIQARRASVSERSWRWCKRNPVVATLTAALALVFLAGFAGVTWKWREARASELREAAQREIAVEQADIATREADRSRRLLYASDMNLAQQAWEAGDTGRARDLLERQWPHAGQDDLRGFEWRYLWPLCQDASRQTLRGHTGEVTEVAFLPDCRTVASSSLDHSLRIWDVASQRHIKLRSFFVDGSLAFSPDGKTLAIVENLSNSVRLWDVAARCERATFAHRSHVWHVAFSPDGKLLASGCEDGTVRIWDVEARREVASLAGHPGQVFCVRFSPDGKTLASCGRGTAVRLWDVAARREIAKFEGHTASVTRLSFSPDGKTLASAGFDGIVRLWDIATRQEVKRLQAQRTALYAVAFSPDGKLLATGGGDGTVRLWDPATSLVTALLRGHTGPITGVAFAPDSRSLVSGSQDGMIKIWDVVPRPDPNTLTDLKSGVDSLAFSPDGKTLAVVDYFDKSVKLWDMASRRIALLRGHEKPVWFVTFAPGGQTLASASVDGSIWLWDVSTKEPVTKFQHENGVHSTAFSPDGKFLAAADPFGQTVLVWEIATRRQVARLLPGSRVQFSPDGTLLAASSGKSVQFWDVATWQPVGTPLRHTAEIDCLAFAPEGAILATGAADGTLQLWDVAGRRQVATNRGHTAHIHSVAFSPDGQRLATGGLDSTVKLWEVAPLQEVTTFTGHHGRIYSLAFSSDGKTLATGSWDATVRLWQAPPLAAVREPAEAPSVLPPTETIRLFSLQLFGTAQATLVNEGNVSRVDVTAVDGTNWHANLAQLFDDLQEGATYTLRFRAKSDAPRTMVLLGQIEEPDWKNIGVNQVVSLIEDWQAYQYEFQAKDLAAENAIHFIFGERTGTVWIADFTLTKSAK